MRKNLTTRSVIIVVTILVCIFGIIGIPTSKTELLDHLKENIRLGLDLKGGSHLVMEVQVQDAVVGDARQTIERLQEELKKQNIAWIGMDVSDAQFVTDANNVVITIKGIAATQSGDFRNLIGANYSTYVLTAVNSTDYSMKMKPSDLVDLKRETVARTIDTISNRINQLGVAESSVQQYGRSGSDYQILIQLPGVDDPARAKQLIGTTAMLEITGVDKAHDTGFSSREDALAKLGGIMPLNEKLVRAKPRAGSQGDEWYLVNKIPVITGREMRNARPGQDDVRKWQTSFTLSPDGGKKFGKYNGGHVNENSVGPSLGADSIHQGIVSGIAGLVAVVTVMLLYYKRSGVNAVLALVLNTVILLAAISYFHAALTLPGIAGVILTIGMAVDSNVLIFERIREELRTGKGVIAAVDAGFGKAWWTIVDTHVTTVVSCAFLFLFGEGPVRGFAVTLTIGLIANIFTAV